MNKYLKNMQKELMYSDDKCELLESVGIELTSQGYDCHRYEAQGSPIDICYIDSVICTIQNSNFLFEAGHYDLPLCQENITE